MNALLWYIPDGDPMVSGNLLVRVSTAAAGAREVGFQVGRLLRVSETYGDVCYADNGVVITIERPRAWYGITVRMKLLFPNDMLLSGRNKSQTIRNPFLDPATIRRRRREDNVSRADVRAPGR